MFSRHWPVGASLVSALILHVVDRLTGGVPIAVASFIRNSPPEYTHAVLSPHDRGRPSHVWDGLRVAHHDLGSKAWSYPIRYRQALRALRPQLVHAHSSIPGALVRALPSHGAPLAYSPHCFKFDDPDIGRAARALYRSAEFLLARRRTHFLVLTPHEASLAGSLRRSTSIHQIPNVASLPSIPARPRLAARPRIGMVGRLTSQKDPSFMVRIAQLSSFDADFVWIGDGQSRHRKALESAGVTVTGWLGPTATAAELDALDVYVHTASYEGFPLSVLDAAARRLPVIARRIPAFIGSGLETFDTADEAASLIRNVLEHPQEARRLEEKSRLLLETMNSSVQETKLRQAWSQLIEHPSR